MRKFIILFFCICFIKVSFSQNLTLTFTWTNINTIQITYDIVEVKAPPDTNTLLSYVNSSLISGTTYIYKRQADNKNHYYRVRAYATNDYYSEFSNTAAVFLKQGLLTPINFKVVIQ